MGSSKPASRRRWVCWGGEGGGQKVSAVGAGAKRSGAKREGKKEPPKAPIDEPEPRGAQPEPQITDVPNTRDTHLINVVTIILKSEALCVSQYMKLPPHFDRTVPKPSRHLGAIQGLTPRRGSGVAGVGSKNTAEAPNLGRASCKSFKITVVLVTISNEVVTVQTQNKKTSWGRFFIIAGVADVEFSLSNVSGQVRCGAI